MQHNFFFGGKIIKKKDQFSFFFLKKEVKKKKKEKVCAADGIGKDGWWRVIHYGSNRLLDAICQTKSLEPSSIPARPSQSCWCPGWKEAIDRVSIPALFKALAFQMLHWIMDATSCCLFYLFVGFCFFSFFPPFGWCHPVFLKKKKKKSTFRRHWWWMLSSDLANAIRF